MKINVLYVFGGEKAQGAEIVIQRLMEHNMDDVTPHLLLSPGKFADKLINSHTSYPVTCSNYLKKLNRSHTKALNFYFSAIRNYFAVSRLVYKYIKQHHIQVVHANTIVPASYLIPLITYLRFTTRRVKFVWSDHDLSYFSSIDHRLSERCVSLYNSTLVVSEAVKKKYPVNDKVKVLYNGLDTQTFRPDADLRNTFRAKLNVSSQTIVIGMPAVVTPRKGQLGLVHAFNNLLPHYPHIKLLFAGGYEEATAGYGEQVKAAISTNDAITHIGYMDSMAAFYNGCDIIVSNSNKAGSEPLGTTIYEAMACGKIIIAANTGGTPEIITDNVDGFLFEPEHITGLQQKLTYAIDNYDSSDEIKAAAISKASSRFNISNMAKRYNDILRNL